MCDFFNKTKKLVQTIYWSLKLIKIPNYMTPQNKITSILKMSFGFNQYDDLKGKINYLYFWAADSRKCRKYFLCRIIFHINLSKLRIQISSQLIVAGWENTAMADFSVSIINTPAGLLKDKQINMNKIRMSISIYCLHKNSQSHVW